MPITGDYVRSPSNWAAKQAEKYEESAGTKANTMRGVPVVILTTKGRKTGALRKSPLMRVEHDGTYAVIASDGGAPKHPAWYLNLTDEPDVMLQDGPERVEMRARVATGDERETWWKRATAVWRVYVAYETKTDRQIPVVLIEPV